jgi:hypothetical protein
MRSVLAFQALATHLTAYALSLQPLPPQRAIGLKQLVLYQWQTA